ncbi:Rqc2 family fibronectin-binding protein [Bacilliculturomica massiliensis]|uniref:Rqc2 family fibronectin-binding protein n=1 Tax=Bacilliculturomica massiliensis TaxID=1917867 RepID=UPI0013EF21E7|nr:NFACT RNA binding domain-containing protein [Bacilliculturomica massiliensis]
MSFDGLVTGAVARQLNSLLAGGKIEKIYQPEPDEITLQIHAGKERHKLYISTNSSHARIHLTQSEARNPSSPPAFCMLLRKHIQGGRIHSVTQKESERIVEIRVDTVNEMGFSVNKCLTAEIMGKHSNLILIDLSSNKIIDSIKRISIDVNRYRQILPGQTYVYPPSQGKTCFYDLDLPRLAEITEGRCAAQAKALMGGLQGVSPVIAGEMVYLASLLTHRPQEELTAEDLLPVLQNHANAILENRLQPSVYMDPEKGPVDFHIFPLSELEDCCERKLFDDVSQAADFFYTHKASSNRIRQKSSDLIRAVNAQLDKQLLKKQRLSEDLLAAENSDIYRLYGELLTANLHAVDPGAKSVDVHNYYDDSQLTIPLDERFSPAKNAQRYFKKYGKAKTAIKEKKIQLLDTEADIQYLESVLAFAGSAESYGEIEALREELCDLGYLRRRKIAGKPVKHKADPWQYATSDGFRVLAGRNNRENDYLTFKTAGKQDLWFHTKDIPGSHIILFTEGREPGETAIFEAAAIAAWHSKGRDSENVPVDYTRARFVKKPAGAKPGMVIFTDNRTVYVDPKLPSGSDR